MGLTPNEIRNQEFSSSMRGYTRSEVEAFKEAAASALEEAKVELLKLTESKGSLQDKYQDLKDLEETLKTSVVEAQRGAEQTVANAKKEAELIITEAKRRRDEVIENKHRALAELETRIHELEFTRKSFYARLRSELESYLKLINQAEAYQQDIVAPSPSENPISSQTGEIDREAESEIDKFVEQVHQENENKEQ